MGMRILRWALVGGICLTGISGCAVWDWLRSGQTAPPPPPSALQEGRTVTVKAPPGLPAPVPPPDTMVVQKNARGSLELVSRPRPPAAVQAPDDTQLVQQSIESWRHNWEAGQASAYLAAYAEGYKGDAATAKAWQAQRRQRLANGRISLQFVNLDLRIQADQATARFTQIYRSSRYEDAGTKLLQLRRIQGRWLIESEQFSKAS